MRMFMCDFGVCACFIYVHFVFVRTYFCVAGVFYSWEVLLWV